MCRAVVLLVFALLLFPSRAAAEVFATTDGTILFSLSRSTLTTPIDAELKVSPRWVWAQTGVKRAARSGGFERREVTVLHEPYELKDGKGARWRMWIRKIAGRLIEIELIRVAPKSFPEQVFKVAEVSVLGDTAESGLPPLTLRTDGHYTLGAIHGRYRRDERGVFLSGLAAHWGRGAYTVRGEGLVFRFKRGLLLYEVRYLKTEPRPEGEEEEDEAVMADK